MMIKRTYQPEKSKDNFVVFNGADIRFERDEHAGGIIMIHGDKQYRVGIMTRAFPLSNPKRWVLARDESGEEIGLIDDISHLDGKSRSIVREELSKSYFLPDITNVNDIDEDLNVVTWEVDTNRGPRTFMVRSVRQNIRRIARFGILIKDVDGNRYRIRDYRELPPRAQQMVEEYI